MKKIAVLLAFSSFFIGFAVPHNVGATSAVGVWTNYSPTLIATSVNPQARTINPNLGIGGIQWGRYTIIGDTVEASFEIKLGTNFNPGIGAYRISLPLPTNQALRNHGATIGTGHLHDVSQGFLGMGPGAYPIVEYHVNSNVDNLHAGIVLGTNGPYISDQTTDSNPWIWSVGDEIIGTLIYERAHS